jgi:hypothetical protein
MPALLNVHFHSSGRTMGDAAVLDRDDASSVSCVEPVHVLVGDETVVSFVEPKRETPSERKEWETTTGGKNADSDPGLLMRRFRVAETTVGALEAALARKQRLLCEAGKRENELRQDLEDARRDAFEPDIAAHGGPDTAGAESRKAEIAAWRERALFSEDARQEAEHTAQRFGDENVALRAVLERTRDADATIDGNAEGNALGGMRLDAEVRAALAEGALVTARQRADAAEAALREWQTHARLLTERLTRAENHAMKVSTSGAFDQDKPQGETREKDAELKTDDDARIAETVARLQRRLEETERLCFELTGRGGGSLHDAATPVTPPESPQERRVRADIAVGKLQRSQAVLKRHERVVGTSPVGNVDGDRSLSTMPTASTFSGSAASSALATALAAARRVSEAADQRSMKGAAALERARRIERAVTKRMFSSGASVWDVDVKRAVARIEDEAVRN